MSKITIIDTAITSTALHCRSFKFYSVYSDSCSVSTTFSHGTSCAKVLDYCTTEYDLINIQILPNSSQMGQKTFGTIEHLKQALSLCQDIAPDIICLSSVSSLLSDSQHLYPLLKRLSKNTTIISALDNKQFITVPSSYPFVLGVQSDRINSINPGEVAFHYHDPFFASFFANCNFPFIQDYHCSPSNSLAVPVVAAYINSCINQRISLQQAIKQLKPYTDNTEENRAYSTSFRPKYEPPIILVHGRHMYNLFSACQYTMNKLFTDYKVQSSGICTCIPKYDIRFRNVNTFENVIFDLEFMKKYYKTDLIFIVADSNIVSVLKKKLDLDIIISIEGCRISTCFHKMYAENMVKNMANIIHHMLQ